MENKDSRLNGEKPKLIDVINLVLTACIGLLAIFVTVKVSTSADYLSRFQLKLATASMLVETDKGKRTLGNDLLQDLSRQGIAQANEDPWLWKAYNVAMAHDDDIEKYSPTGSTALAQTSSLRTFDIISSDIKSPPRIFVEVGNAELKDAAKILRSQLSALRFDDGSVLVPPVEIVATGPGKTQLRILKKSDLDAGRNLTSVLNKILPSLHVICIDMSAKYDTNSAVKEKTFELWIPEDTAEAQLSVVGNLTTTKPDSPNNITCERN